MVTKFDQELDCSGLSCPMPILKTSTTVKAMEVGKVLKMTSTDPGSIPDMQAWARKLGHTLLAHEKDGEKFIFYVQKNK